MNERRIEKTLRLAHMNAPEGESGDAGQGQPGGGGGGSLYNGQGQQSGQQQPGQDQGQGQGQQPADASPYSIKNYIKDEGLLAELEKGGVKDVASLASEYSKLKNSPAGDLRLPGENATEEEVNAFYKKLGVPDAPDAYKFDEEGAAFDDPNVAPLIKKAAHASKLTDKQASEFWKQLNTIKAETDSQMHEQFEKMGQQTMGILATRHGDNIEGAIGKIQSTVREVAGPELAPQIEAFLAKPEYGSNPLIMTFLDNLATKLGEHRVLGVNSGNGSGGQSLVMSKAAAKREIDATLADKSHPYWNGDKGARDRVLELFKLVDSE